MNKGKSPFWNAVYLFTGRILSALFGFLSTVYCAQRVGVLNFGWLTFSLSLVSYGLILTDFGLLTFGVRKMVQSPEEKRFPQELISLRLLLALIVFSLLFILSQKLNKPPAVKKLIIFYSLFLFANSLSLEWFFQAKERMDYVGINRILISFGYLLLLFLLVRKELDYQRVPFAFLFGQVVGAIFLLLVYKKEKGEISLIFSPKIFKRLFLSALPLGTINILQILYTYFGIILLGFIGQGEELGIYSAMHRLLLTTLIIDFVASFLFLPLITSFYQSEFNNLPKVFEILNRVVLFFTLPVVIICLIFSQPLISFFLGRNYLAGISLLRILIFFLPLTTLSTLYGTGLLAQKREKTLLLNTLIGTLFNIASSPILYFSLGSRGIALGLVSGELIILTFNLIAVRRKIRFSLKKSLIPILTRDEIRFLTRREL